MINKISQFMNNLDEQFSNEKCVPQHFLRFTSSSYDQKSISLPGREFNISIPEHPRTRVFGNFFSSIFIESLLDKNSLQSHNEFSASIENLFNKYREDFERIIKGQNVPIQGKTINESLFTSEEIESFFRYEKKGESLLFRRNR